MLQYIASGLLGPSSFQGGLGTAAAGTVLRFFIAFAAAAVYVLASRRVPILQSGAILFGLPYGVAVYFFMNYAVLALDAADEHSCHEPAPSNRLANGQLAC